MHCLHWKWKKANVTFHVKTIIAIGVAFLYYFRRACNKIQTLHELSHYLSLHYRRTSPSLFFVGRHLSPGSHKLSKVTLPALTTNKGQVSSNDIQLKTKLIFFFISPENKQGTIMQNVFYGSSNGFQAFRGRIDKWILSFFFNIAIWV